MGGSPPLSLTTSICENFDPFLSFIKRQNNPKYGNLSRNFHIFLTASGEGRGGSTQAVSLTAFSQFFFLNPSLRTLLQSEKSHIKVKRRCRWTPINILQCVRYYNMCSIVYNITNISILWLQDAEPFICQPQEASSSSQVFFRRDSVPFGVKTRYVVAVRRAGAQTGIAALVQEASDSLRLPH